MEIIVEEYGPPVWNNARTEVWTHAVYVRGTRRFFGTLLECARVAVRYSFGELGD